MGGLKDFALYKNKHFRHVLFDLKYIVHEKNNIKVKSQYNNGFMVKLTLYIITKSQRQLLAQPVKASVL